MNLNVTQFQAGDFVDVIGRSKGKGFQGVMKKHNMAGQGAAHGSKTHRRNGAIGNRSTPGRIWKNMGMPGHLGDERVTVQNLQVMQVRESEKIILVSGAVPGSNGSFVVVRPAIKKPAKRVMSAKVLTKAAAKEAKIALIENGRGTQAMHDVVVAMRAARRSGTANTKTKADVDLSGAKPWRQKGHRSCPRGLQVIGHLAWWWRRFRAEAARLFKENFKIGPPAGVSEGTERADQCRRRAYDRRVRGDGD